MKIKKTKIKGAFLIERDVHKDDRGYFSRSFCKRELVAAGLDAAIAQINLSGNNKKGTLRGLHMQTGRHMEDKLVTCTTGEIFDVCVDFRGNSDTYGDYIGVRLTGDNALALYVPKGCAHGYLTLTDRTQVLYATTEFYTPDAEMGFRYDDPFLGIAWPLSPPYIITDKDRAWPLIDKRKRDD